MTATPETTTSKVVLITGASSSIGYHTALHLAAQGHKLLVGARRTDRLDELVAEIRAGDGTADAHELDVTDLGSMQAFVDEAQTRYGRIDALVANAGVMPLSRLDALKVDEWNRMVDVNVRGVLHAIATILPVFQRQDAGHFVTVASIGAHRVSPTAAVYCATKYAAWALTEGAAPRGRRPHQGHHHQPRRRRVRARRHDLGPCGRRADAHLPIGEHPARGDRPRHRLRHRAA